MFSCMNGQNLIKWTLSLLITFVVTRVIIGLITSDGLLSILPGWHTVIYSKETTITLLSLIILASSAVVCFLFRFINRCISNLVSRFFK